MTKPQAVRYRWGVGLLSLAAGAALGAEPLNVKPGLWEMSTTTALNLSMMPPALLARMPPEQRARLEASMKEHGAGGHANTTKSCVTKEELLRGHVRAEKDEDHMKCQYRVVTQTAARMETHFHCTGEGTRDGEIKMEAVNPEQLQGAIQVTTPNGKVNVQVAGHWLGSSCAGAKD